MGHRELVALIVRCSGLSDGARCTFLELSLHIKRGVLPSLNEMKRIRNTSRSAIQNHMHELVEQKILRKRPGEGNRTLYELREKVLLKLNGLTRSTDVEKWIPKYAQIKIGQIKVVQNLLKPSNQWNPFDVLAYFEALASKRKAFVYVKSAKLKNQHLSSLRRCLADYGGRRLQKMIDYYDTNQYRWHGSEYGVEDFFSRRHLVLGFI